MKLLFAGNYYLDEKQIEELKQLNIEIVIMEDEQGIIPTESSSIDMIVCNWLFTNHNIEQFTNLKYIQLLSAGMDRVPIEYIREHNIVINNARGVYSIPMAEYAVMGVLELFKNSKQFIQNQTKSKWIKNRDIDELSDKTVCILGVGSVGHEVAKRFSVFCDKIIGVDVVDRNDKYVDEYYYIGDLDKAVENSDVIVITLPLLDSTKYLIDKELIDKMQKRTIVVNLSRGQVIKENDLIEALRKGNIRGAVLDVFEKEPLDINNPLWKMHNVIVTPHNSFESTLNKKRMWELLTDNMKRFLENGRQ